MESVMSETLVSCRREATAATSATTPAALRGRTGLAHRSWRGVALALSAAALLTTGAARAQSPTPEAHGVHAEPPAVVQQDLALLDSLIDGRPMRIDAQPDPAIPIVGPDPTPRAYGVTLSASLIFPHGSDELSASMLAQVEDAVYLMQQPDMADWTVQVVGHADSTGAAAHNDALSLRRAEAARAYMVARGIPAERIVVVAGGQRADDPGLRPSISQALNRRVDLIVHPR
jgi:outer membrane protein OmpA-like peptidoglycan-associated protein